jgi:hypothetical protein
MSEDAFTYVLAEQRVDRSVRPPTAAQALASFLRLDRQAMDPSFSFELRPIATCASRYVDVHVHDAEGNPLQGVPVVLDFPEGAGRKGTTDATGTARFDDLYVDVAGLFVEVHREWPDDEERPTYRARVVAAAPPGDETTAVTEPPEDEPVLYFRPWADVPDSDEREDEDVP